MIVWKTVEGPSDNRIEVPEPREGVDQQFDEANEAVNKIKRELDEFRVKLVK